MENGMKHLMKYVAETGCIKINGVLFENWVGDGIFSLYFSENLPEGFRRIRRVLFDLRDGEKLRVNFVDAGCSEIKDFYEKDLSGLLTLAVNDNGDFCLVKY